MEGDPGCWQEINLFQNPLSFFIAGISLSGNAIQENLPTEFPSPIHTPELTTLGVSAKGWFREQETLYLYKIGKYEIPADQILSSTGIPHLSYQAASKKEKGRYLTSERREWVDGVHEEVVKSCLFTSQETAFVTFEEFRRFCDYYDLNAFEQARMIDRNAWNQMQIADYILNNSDRHEQNWGFLMDNDTGMLTGYCPLFDHENVNPTWKPVIIHFFRL